MSRVRPPHARCGERNPKEFPESSDNYSGSVYFRLVIIAFRYLSGFEYIGLLRPTPVVDEQPTSTIFAADISVNAFSYQQGWGNRPAQDFDHEVMAQTL